MFLIYTHAPLKSTLGTSILHYCMSNDTPYVGMYLSVYLSIYLPIYLSMYLYIYIYTKNLCWCRHCWKMHWITVKNIFSDLMLVWQVGDVFAMKGKQNQQQTFWVSKICHVRCPWIASCGDLLYALSHFLLTKGESFGVDMISYQVYPIWHMFIPFCVPFVDPKSHLGSQKWGFP